MKSSARNIRMPPLDQLFEAGSTGSMGETIHEILLKELFPFKDHPFKVLDDENMTDMVESIKQYGVLVPAIARSRPAVELSYLS